MHPTLARMEYLRSSAQLVMNTGSLHVKNHAEYFTFLALWIDKSCLFQTKKNNRYANYSVTIAYNLKLA